MQRFSRPLDILGLHRTANRRGNILPLAAFSMVMILGFTAFTVDVGFIMQTRSQMQSAADGSVLAAALEMPDGWGAGKTLAAADVDAHARSAAQTVATMHRVGEQAAAYLDTTRDVRFGQRAKDAQGNWVESWGTAPYNMVEVTIHRDQPLSGNAATRADQSLPLFFGRALGSKYASLTAKSTAVLTPGAGFQITPGSSATCPLLPIALDEQTWNDLIQNGVGSDNYRYNANGTVSAGTDGIKEVNLYPSGSGSLPPGNRGTIDIGPANNSTADLSRQIRNGPNASDLAYFGGKVEIPTNGTLAVNGDTGLSAGIKDDLASIIGKPRAIAIFRSVSGPGNNATYQIVKFVGIRILYVQLTGSPSKKRVVVQPAPVVDGTIIRGKGALEPDSILAPLQIIH